MKLKVEINTREHFNMPGYREEPFSMKSGWFSGNCNLTTYNLDELLGTKLRALYQRRKGRDLFDLWLGLTLGKANPNALVRTFRKYMETEGHSVSKKEFRENLLKKMQTKSFLTDTDNLLRPTINYDRQKAFQVIDQQLLELL